MTSVRQQPFLEQVLDNTPSGLLVVDPTGRIRYVNNAGEKILHRSANAICGAYYHDEHWGITNFHGGMIEPGEPT